jgi:NAD(P)-dependent dehydrogenase (short-subunit alcohol dehydrogenase family)
MASSAPRVCAITGATSGIGSATAAAMTRLGYQVVIVGRDPQRCAQTIARLRNLGPVPPAEPVIADLSVRAGVREAAERIAADHPRLHVLINNAGGLFTHRRETSDGHEMTFALNVLAPFELTRFLEPQLHAAGGARVVNVASEAHRPFRMDFTDLEGRRHFGGWRAYGRSKLALILLTRAFARRDEPALVQHFAVHPGFVRSGFGKNNGWAMRLLMPIAMLAAISPERGARTVVYGATSPELNGRSGEYLSDEHVRASSSAAEQDEDGERLYRTLAEMSGLSVSI